MITFPCQGKARERSELGWGDTAKLALHPTSSRGSAKVLPCKGRRGPACESELGWGDTAKLAFHPTSARRTGQILPCKGRRDR
jgi:hypothetical protein